MSRTVVEVVVVVQSSGTVSPKSTLSCCKSFLPPNQNSPSHMTIFNQHCPTICTTRLCLVLDDLTHDSTPHHMCTHTHIHIYMLTEKKILAEHGAAARAYDCFSYRHYFATPTRSVRLGLESPYLEATMAQELDPTSLPPPLPILNNTVVQQQIETLVQEARQRCKVLTWNDGVDQKMEEQEKEEEQKRVDMEIQNAQEYRQVRSGGGGGGGNDGLQTITPFFDNAFDDALE